MLVSIPLSRGDMKHSLFATRLEAVGKERRMENRHRQEWMSGTLGLALSGFLARTHVRHTRCTRVRHTPMCLTQTHAHVSHSDTRPCVSLRHTPMCLTQTHALHSSETHARVFKMSQHLCFPTPSLSPSTPFVPHARAGAQRRSTPAPESSNNRTVAFYKRDVRCRRQKVD